MPYSGDFGDPCIFDNRRSDFFGNASETIQKSGHADCIRGTGQRNEIKQFIEASPGAGKRISVVSGGKGSGEEISEAEAMYEYLVSQGIDETRLI